MMRRISNTLLAVGLAGAATLSAGAQATVDARARRPDAIVNLATPEGVGLVQGTWRYSDARIVEVEHKSPGPDLKSSGPPIRTNDISPEAGGAVFDDTSWEQIGADTLEKRRSGGRLCFNW